jgi:hypothetical protein
VLLSRVRMCEAVGVNPQAYLADVLMRIDDWQPSRIDELLFNQWQAGGPARPESTGKVLNDGRFWMQIKAEQGIGAKADSSTSSADSTATTQRCAEKQRIGGDQMA